MAAPRITAPEPAAAPAPPPAPRPARRRTPAERAHAYLTSPKLAIALLVGVLACCVVGVTVFRGARAWELIFSTLWFNALLVLLAVSSAAAFFTRIWRRKLTLVSAGMILFHVSFAALLGGVVYNGLFRFAGVLRLTEGETLPNDRPDSYDVVEQGRLFRFSRLRGRTTLVRMHRDYKVGGANKRAAYEIAVEDGPRLAQGIIYITEFLDFGGVRYFCQKEGYSVLVMLSEPDGREVYGAHVPLQSFKQADSTFAYVTGSKTGPLAFTFPPPPLPPRGDLLVAYRPSAVAEREGEVSFELWPPGLDGGPGEVRKGRVVVGAPFDAGGFTLTPREIRYWVGMNVRYDPGLPVVFASLVSGLVGMTLTFAGRLRQGPRKRSTQAR